MEKGWIKVQGLGDDAAVYFTFSHTLPPIYAVDAIIRFAKQQKIPEDVQISMAYVLPSGRELYDVYKLKDFVSLEAREKIVQNLQY